MSYKEVLSPPLHHPFSRGRIFGKFRPDSQKLNTQKLVQNSMWCNSLGGCGRHSILRHGTLRLVMTQYIYWANYMCGP